MQEGLTIAGVGPKIVYKITLLPPSRYAVHFMNNTVHVYCAVYTVTPAPLPPKYKRRDSSFTRPVWCGMYIATDL